jgi:hypothetical protein
MWWDCLWTAVKNKPKKFIVSRIIYEYGEPQWNNTDSWQLKNSGKGNPGIILPTINDTWTDPDVTVDVHSERPATNHLTHGVA